MVRRFAKDVNKVVLHQGEEDSWCWKPNALGIYLARDEYKILLRNDIVGDDLVVFKRMWKYAAPSNVTPFTWRLLFDKSTDQKQFENQECCA